MTARGVPPTAWYVHLGGGYPLSYALVPAGYRPNWKGTHHPRERIRDRGGGGTPL